MVRPFFTNIRLLILTIILILAWGISSFQGLPQQEDPELVSRVAVVKTAFPGASADRVEALVTTVLEEELSEIEEIEVLESDSRVGFSTVAVELVDQVINAQPIWAKVRDEMADAAAQFPAGAAVPELDETAVKAYTMIASLTWNLPGEPNYAILRRYSDELGTRLRSLTGTEEVEFFGSPDEEILVEIDAPKLAGIGVSPQQLAQEISLSDAKVTAGQLRNPEQDLAIEVESELETLDQIRQLPVQSASGQFTRLNDIASVSRGVRYPLSDQAIVSGKPAVVIGIMMQSGLRIDQWSAQVHDELDVFRDRLPQGVSLDLVFDQSTYVATRINSLITNLVFSAVLVVLVALMGMGWSSALVVGLALPLTIFAVLGWMSIFGVPIHQMSVTGLIIALGLLIDNAVVAVDEIQVEMRHGEPPLQAVIKTVNYLQVPLLASTLTTVLTFLPIYLLPGAAGEFVGSIALNVILSLISSLVISLTVISALAGRILSASSEDYEKALHKRQKSFADRVVLVLMKPGAWWYDGFSSPRLGRFYRWTINRATARPLLAVALTMTIPLIGFISASTLDEQFFPLVNRDQFQIEIDFVSQTAIAQTKKVVLEAREQILQHEEVEDVHWFIGENAPKFYYNLTGNRENQSQYAQALVQLKSDQNVGRLVRELQQVLDKQFPAARTIVQQLQQGPPYDAPVEMRIYGPNTSELRRIGMEVREIITEIPDVVHIRDDLTERQPKLGLIVDNEQVQQAGLTNTEIAQQLEAYSEGVTGGAILESTENLPVRVRLTNTNRASLTQLASLDLRPGQSGDRAFRPTTALGEFSLIGESSNISRRGEQRVNTIQAYITAGVLPDTVLNALQERLESVNFTLPPGYSYDFGGEYAERNSAVGNLLLYVPLLLLVMVTALVLSLGSFRQTGIVGAVAVGSIGMAMFSLKVFGSLLGFMAIVGTMGLVGIALNGGIIVLSALNEDPQARLGDLKAVQNVVVKATRHVLTTTITTMVGFVPLLVDSDPFWQPLAIAIAGGIGGSPLLALYFTPAAYLLLIKKKPAHQEKQNGVANNQLSLNHPA
ncbi:acriflavin resistance protein [Leptolyngbya sp. Heron Island J]|uniref:efflux RND transporter permease subunit n=1 Tax=Leptolyngbya sp. Heron Island J TaxID=1385935 RepID=UPI0003B9D0DD|nr:efflux RND transporter permease subunit [Leptolyngbya sp. Heron Island J]ESA33938.1 acriflavin resistance protein [Leptolyngbya sp. Heron Island J]